MPSSTDGPGDPLEDGLAGATKPGKQRAAAPADPVEDDASEGELLADKDWLEFFKASLKAADSFQQQTLRGPWARNYRAFMNRHMTGSKYDSFRYRNRSKLFKPKTRSAVRKNDATAASAMFSTSDVVSITAERDTDPVQRMTARFISADLNYRLDRNTKMTGPSWFLTAIGARQDAQITGICVSKQYWEFEEKEYDVIVEYDEPVIDVNGMPSVDPATGEGVVETKQRMEKKREVCRDRLMIDLLPPEMAFIDVSGDWRDPIQEGGYFIAGYPMRKDDIEAQIAAAASRPMKGGGAWRTDINVKQIMQATVSNSATRQQTVRRAREDGQDRYESRHQDAKNGDIIWIYEAFYRYGGEDWHFWTLGENILLSDPQPTRDAYPEQQGDRPYVMGVGALEAHKTHPMAPVESWSPLQQEMNDVTNLTLDAQKMAISPITKIVRGRGIDFKQVQNRGPDAMIMVEKEDDVTFDRAPPPDGSQQMQLNNLTVDFDELAGVFSTSSVQSNRQLNETVGGMNLMAGTSNALTEFDLRVWAETWAEPMLRQCVRCIQHFETSERAIALCGEKAGLIVVPEQPQKEPSPLEKPKQAAEQQVTLAQVLDNLDDAIISVKVNIGIGALDSKQKLEKFATGTKMTIEMGPLLDAAGIIPDGPEMMNELWGLLGYKDADRFFRPKPQGDGQPPPEVQKIMLQMEAQKQKMEGDAKAREQEFQIRQNEFKLEMQQMMEELRQAREEAAIEIQLKRDELGIKREIGAMTVDQKRQAAAIDRHNAVADAHVQQRTREMDMEAAETEHEMKTRHAEEMSKLKIKTAKAAAAAKPKPKTKPNGGARP